MSIKKGDDLLPYTSSGCMKAWILFLVEGLENVVYVSHILGYLNYTFVIRSHEMLLKIFNAFTLATFLAYLALNM